MAKRMVIIMEIIQEITTVELYSHIIRFSAGEYELHWHENYEICQVLKNSCRIFVDGRYIEASEGDIVTISERAVHRFIVDNDDTYVRVTQFPFKILLSVDNEIKPLKIHISADEIEKKPILKQRLNLIFDIMEQEGAVKIAKNNLFLQSLITSYYFLLMYNFCAEDCEKYNKKERKEFYKIITYVNEHFSEELNVTRLAEKLYISRGRLATIFTKYAGMSLTEYINSLRIKKVNQLLSDEYAITEAAFESGFQSIRTFNNAYKAHMGITPTEYVKNMLT